MHGGAGRAHPSLTARVFPVDCFLGVVMMDRIILFLLVVAFLVIISK